MPSGFGLYTEELRHSAHVMQTGPGVMLPSWLKRLSKIASCFGIMSKI